MGDLLDPDTLFVLLIFGGPLIAFAMILCYKIAKVNSDNELKRRLVERGLSVDEIERIIKAGTEKDEK
jgi:hypothetical protein